MKRYAIFGVLLLLSCVGLGVAWAGPLGRSGDGPGREALPAIYLRAATFVPALGQEPAPSLWPGSLPAEETGQALVQFRGPILPAWREALEATGAQILAYIPDYAYRVRLERVSLEQLRRLPGVLWVGPYRPAYRLSPELASAEGRAWRVEWAEEPDKAVLETLPALGLRVIGREGRSMVLAGERGQVAALARLPHVEWIAPLALARPMNDIATGEIRVPAAWDAGYTGEGQIIAVADTGLDTGVDYPHVVGDMHRDLDNRVIRLRSWPIAPLYYGYLNNPLADDGAADLDAGHGTHVAGSAVGNGYHSGGRYRGVAPGALLAFQALEQYCDLNAAGEEVFGGPDGYYLVGLPADLGQHYGEAYGWGARIHTNSWAGGAPGVYDVWAQQTDRFVWEHRDMLILFATGNAGADADGDGRVDAGSVLPPATAKNIIAVGGTENRRPAPDDGWQTYGQFNAGAFPADPLRSDPMADAGADGLMAFSGRGPTLDGRLAPHVVAPGTWIISLRSSVARRSVWGNLDAYYMYNGGTSMSAPLVAGAAALVRQADLAQGHAPSAALIKATLLHTARDIPGQYPAPYGEAGPIPNNDEGWGAVDVRAATTSMKYFVDQTTALQTGQQAVYTYRAGAGAQPAKFTLVWTDYPAALEAAKQLVNDLDLTITAPDGQVYRGNVFSGGWSLPGGAADRTNNVEAVYLPQTLAGTYTVTISAHNIPFGPQDFALVVSLAPPPQIRRAVLPLVLRYRRELPAPAPTPAPGELRDDFSRVTGMWPVTTTQEYVLDYVAGEYRLRLSPAQWRLQAPLRATVAGDMLVEVDGRAVNAARQAYGLFFGGAGQGAEAKFVAFIVSPTGYYALVRYQAATESFLVPWTAAEVIQRGAATNRLAVARVGDWVHCAVNGVPLLALQETGLAQGTQLGLIAFCWEAPYAEARFDNFRLLPLGGLLGLEDAAQARAGASMLSAPPDPQLAP